MLGNTCAIDMYYLRYIRCFGEIYASVCCWVVCTVNARHDSVGLP